MNALNPYLCNYETVQAEAKAAALAVNRSPDEVTIVTVTKTVGPEAIPDLLAAGMHHFGENRWQQAKDKLALYVASNAVWHFIGRLQTNKVKYIVPRFDWIHSMDSLELAQAVHAKAVELGKQPKVLVQVNVSGEETKAGFTLEGVKAFLQSIRSLHGLQVCGLMTMAPFTAEVEETRPVFRALRELLFSLQHELSWPELKELSMGMSNDFNVAIEEGATLVRIGRRLTLGSGS